MSGKFKQTGSARKYYKAEIVRTLARPQRTVRKHLNADALLEAVKKDFKKFLITGLIIQKSPLMMR